MFRVDHQKRPLIIREFFTFPDCGAPRNTLRIWITAPERILQERLLPGANQKTIAEWPKSLVVHRLAVLPCATLKAFVPGIF